MLSHRNTSPKNTLIATFAPPTSTHIDTGNFASPCHSNQRIQKIFDADNADRISLLIDDCGEAAG